MKLISNSVCVSEPKTSSEIDTAMIIKNLTTQTSHVFNRIFHDKFRYTKDPSPTTNEII